MHVALKVQGHIYRWICQKNNNRGCTQVHREKWKGKFKKSKAEFLLKLFQYNKIIYRFTNIYNIISENYLDINFVFFMPIETTFFLYYINRIFRKYIIKKTLMIEYISYINSFNFKNMLIRF